MALTTLGFPLYYPQLEVHGNASINSGTTIDAAGEYFAYVLAARENMSVTHVGLKLATATGSPTADIRIETIDTGTGAPSGTLWATNTNIVTGTLTTTWAVHALTATATINKGQLFCVKVLYNSGTSMVESRVNGYLNPNSGFPYAYNNTGTPAYAAMSYAPQIGLGSSSTAFYSIPEFLPISTWTNNAFNNSTAGAARGVRFQVPFDCRLAGVQWFAHTSTGAFNVKILDEGGSELSSSSTAYPLHPNGASLNRCLMLDNAVSLTRNTWYRAIIEPTTTTNVNVTTVTAASTDVSEAMFGGNYWHYTTFTTGGGWVDSATTQYPHMSLIIDQVDDGTGSGAGGAHFSAFAG